MGLLCPSVGILRAFPRLRVLFLSVCACPRDVLRDVLFDVREHVRECMRMYARSCFRACVRVRPCACSLPFTFAFPSCVVPFQFVTYAHIPGCVHGSRRL